MAAIVIDSLRQRSCVLSARLRRYKRASARKKENKSFGGDEKQFYRELSRAQLQDEQIEVPQIEDMAHYWSGI